jgi:hypothetical protein
MFKSQNTIRADQITFGKLVKVFEDHLYFLDQVSGVISVLSYWNESNMSIDTTVKEVKV